MRPTECERCGMSRVSAYDELGWVFELGALIQYKLYCKACRVVVRMTGGSKIYETETNQKKASEGHEN